MIEADAAVPEGTKNHPLAVPMALIASLTFNVCVGSIYGTPGVLLGPMRERLGASTEMVSGGALAVIVFSALFSPQIGSLAVRQPLKRLVAAAAIMLSLAWFVLAFTKSYLLYLACYGLLLGPVMAIGASVVPPTLVTRWFTRNRGLAIGLVHLPIVVAALPLICEALIGQIGLQNTLLCLAVFPLVTLLPASFFIVDWPEESASSVGTAAAGEPSRHHPHGPTYTILDLLRRPRFWALSLAVGVANTSSTMLGLHLVSMAQSWGIAPLAAAGLASIMSAVGMIGSVVLGYLADRIGGAKTLAVMAGADALLWLLFLVGLPYVGLAATVGLIGLFGSGAVPAFSKAMADNFGRESFSRAVGLMVPVTLPVLALGLIGPGTAVRIFGDYTVVIVTTSIAFVAAMILALAGSRPPRPEGEVTPA